MKQRHLSDLFREIRNGQSIFTRIFGGLAVLLLLLITALTFWSNRVTSANHRSQIAQSSFSRLESAVRSSEQVLDSISDSTVQTYWNRDILQYLLHPEKEERSMLLNVLQTIQREQQNSDLVKSISLFIPARDAVLTDESKYVYAADDFSDNYLFAADPELLDDYTPLKDYGIQGVRTYLLTKSERIFLLSVFDISSTLGMMACEIDPSVFSRMIGNETGQTGEIDQHIYIYDSEGKAVFGAILNYDRADTLKTEDKIIAENQINRVSSRQEELFEVGSDYLGWSFYMISNPTLLTLPITKALLTWSPIFVVLCLFSLMVSVYVVMTIYRPIRQLMKVVTDGNETVGMQESGFNRSGRMAGDKHVSMNEFGYLETAYSKAREQRQQMSEMLQSVAPEILNSLLLRLLTGKEEETEIRETLEGIGCPIPLRGRYLVCACAMEEPHNRSVTDAEWNLYQVSLRKIIKEVRTMGDGRVDPVRIDRNTIALVLSFPDQTSAVAVKKEYAALQRSILRRVDALPYRIWIDCGQICTNLIDISESYREAIGKIHYQQYNDATDSQNREAATFSSGNDSDTSAAGATDVNELQIGKRFLREKTRNLVALAAKGSLSASAVSTEQLLGMIEQQSKSVHEYRLLASAFADELMECLISYPLTEEEQHYLSDSEDFQRIRSGESTEVIELAVQTYSRRLCELISVYNRKNQFKYVTQAKEYIADNYSNSILSLNDVADHVGISASYLSELFNENGGGKFSEYLATYRVTKARQLLRMSEMPIKNIGFQCGFNSVQNFNRVFKKLTNMTPGQYRDSERMNDFSEHEQIL